MSDFFKKDWINISEYPDNYIPNGCEAFMGVDLASPDGDCTIKGFHNPDTGEIHIQEVVYSERLNPYSWSIKYFDDWRCVADYLREIAEDNTNEPHNNIPE